MKHIARGLTKRCPQCGRSDVFETWWRMRSHCPDCGIRFERDSGYGTGAMMVNTAVTIGIFLAVFVGTMFITWPDVPWRSTLLATIGVNALVPVLFYPWSKTIFLGLDLSVRPLSDAEVSAAAEWLANRR